MNIVITGATGGIGKALSLAYAKEPSNQILAIGRNQNIGLSLEKENSNITFLQADLSSSEGIEKCLVGVGEGFAPVDILIHSAGGIVKKHTFTQDGIEMTFAIQFLARLEISVRLMDHMNKAPQAKVLSIAGGGAIKQEFNYDLLEKSSPYNPWQVLKNTSVANDMMVYYLSQENPDVLFYSYGPGLVHSPHHKRMPLPMRLMASTLGRLFSISINQVVQDIDDILSNQAEGLYFRRYGKKETWGEHLPDKASISKLIDYSKQLIENRKK